jgi:hypothetical protein
MFHWNYFPGMESFFSSTPFHLFSLSLNLLKLNLPPMRQADDLSNLHIILLSVAFPERRIVVPLEIVRFPICVVLFLIVVGQTDMRKPFGFRFAFTFHFI